MAFEVLQSTLRYLAHWYDQEGLEEVAINRPEEVWLRLRGKRANPWISEKDKNLSRAYLTDIMYIIANTYGLPFDPDHGTPLVFATLPGDHRFSGIAGRNVMYDNTDLLGGIALCIRIHTGQTDFGLEEFGLEKGKELTRLKPKIDNPPTDPFERLMLMLKRGEHILISGATATGKTTFLNNLLQIINQHLRIITIEDSRELLVPHKNHVHLVLSRTEQTNQFNYAKLIDLIVRMTPDAIIGGEISTSNAGAIWELMGSGHDNCYATIHAESPDAAYKAFIDRILHTYPALNRDKLIIEMKKRLHVVQINRDGNYTCCDRSNLTLFPYISIFRIEI